jgi:hypothetical protein
MQSESMAFGQRIAREPALSGRRTMVPLVRADRTTVRRIRRGGQDVPQAKHGTIIIGCRPLPRPPKISYASGAGCEVRTIDGPRGATFYSKKHKRIKCLLLPMPADRRAAERTIR